MTLPEIKVIDNYKSKFRASENNAHNQNVATKILRDMQTLRSLANKSRTVARRWVWELIQNAKDVHPEGDGVSIKIEYSTSSPSLLKFSHTGEPFSTDNIRFLIEQISTKDRKKDESGRRKQTGKFGTGFLTTHLLSEFVTVEGVAKEAGLDPRKFKLELDRSGYEPEEISLAVEKSKGAVEDLDSKESFLDYKRGEFNTSFLYPLQDETGLRVAEAGLSDLMRCLPFTFTFVKELSSVIFTHAQTEIKRANQKKLTDQITITQVDFATLQGVKKTYVLTATKGFTTIAIPVDFSNVEITFLQMDENVPFLFCDFPLIGTEKFSFPCIVNNPNFNPTDPRDGVFLTTSPNDRPNKLEEENKQIIEDAISLYINLLNYAAENGWKNLHILAKIHGLRETPDWIDHTWYENNVLQVVHKELLHAKIVTTAKEKLASIWDKNDEVYMWFPSGGTKETRLELWQLAKEWFPHRIPQQGDIELWNRLAWEECGKLTVWQLCDFVSQMETLAELQKMLSNKNVYEWLNDFYRLIKKDEREYHNIVANCAIFPDQLGSFNKLAQLRKDRGDIGDEFKDILTLLDDPIREGLLDENIGIEIEADDVIDKMHVVQEITSAVHSKAGDREVAKGYMPAFNKLLIWFRRHPDVAKTLFPTLYREKHLLYDDEEIIENIDKAEQFDGLLSEFNVTSASELRQLVASRANTPELMPVTQEILLSMGISTVDEWKEAIKDKDLAMIYSHESTPTTDMFVYAQGLIDQAKANIISHLATRPEYDLTDLDDSTARTILTIKKYGETISIVTRPAYNGEVIIYYGSEQDVLDYEKTSELWIDDGTKPRSISLGHILKSAGIVKFPIKQP